MEALILSCGTGGGHDSAAKAVAEELTRRGSSATVLNLFTLENERTAELVNELYIQVVQAAPKLFGAAYKAGEAYRNLQVHSPVYGPTASSRTPFAATWTNTTLTSS